MQGWCKVQHSLNYAAPTAQICDDHTLQCSHRKFVNHWPKILLLWGSRALSNEKIIPQKIPGPVKTKGAYLAGDGRASYCKRAPDCTHTRHSQFWCNGHV